LYEYTLIDLVFRTFVTKKALFGTSAYIYMYEYIMI